MPHKTHFLPKEHFASPGGEYRFLPFRFLRWSAEEVLVVNDIGESLFLSADQFAAFAARRLPRGTQAYADLKSRHFLWDGASTVPLDLVATKYRTKKGFLQGFTKLHLFVVTLRCDHSCRYCQVSRVTAEKTKFDMSEETARRAVDLMFHSPSPALKVEFQGGEPLLHFERIRSTVLHILERNLEEKRQIEFVVTTNLVPLTDEMLDFFRNHQILLSTSIDGPAFIHDANRLRRGGGSHAAVLKNLEQARAALGEDRVSAMMTTTELSLSYPREIVDEYLRLGFSSIFLRSISPYGLAVKTGEALRYQTHQFLSFYQTALDHIIEVNRSGFPFVEVYAQILLSKILTPFPNGYVDLQSPAGAGLGAVAYNYDGDVYVSDEARMLAEMGDRSYRLGSVHQDEFASLFGGEVMQALVRGSVLEALPGCTDCAFLPYCGADPLFHHRTQGDMVGHRPTSDFCAKNMAILRLLFQKLRSGDPFVESLFIDWASGFCRAPHSPAGEQVPAP
jgi:His-Xaa-Ser system radical SAM maturase HxsB